MFADTFKKLKFQQLPQTQASEMCSPHCHPLREQWAAAGPHSGNHWLIQTPSPICEAEHQAGRHWAPFLSSLMWPSRGLNPQPPSHNVDIIPLGCSLSENQKQLKKKQKTSKQKRRECGCSPSRNEDSHVGNLQRQSAMAASPCVIHLPDHLPSLVTRPQQSHLTRWVHNITSGTTSLLVLHDPSNSHRQFGDQDVKAFLDSLSYVFF